MAQAALPVRERKQSKLLAVFGVFDGNRGATVARLLQDKLVRYMLRQLRDGDGTGSPSSPHTPDLHGRSHARRPHVPQAGVALRCAGPFSLKYINRSVLVSVAVSSGRRRHVLKGGGSRHQVRQSCGEALRLLMRRATATSTLV